MRQPGVVPGIERRPQDWLEPGAALRRRPLEEGRRHKVRPGLDRDARGQPGIERGDDRGGVGRGHRVICVTADRGVEHPGSIYRVIDLVGLEETPDGTQVGLEQLRLDV